MLSETSCKQPTSVAYVKLAALFLISATLTWSANRPDRFALILDGAPLAAEARNRKDLRRLAVSEARGKVLAAHNTLRAALAERKIRVTGANQTLANVVFIETSGTTEADLLALPGVAYVEKLRPMELHLNRGLELMNVPAAWGLVNGEQNAGAGVKIGILDSGIDHTHPAFRDDGFQFPAGFPKCQEVRGECAYTNRKIIAARSYVNMLVGTDPETSRPDDLSPRDRVGHGTAVAMIAAGVRNTGPATTVTGVAPKAYLGNYKVFGSPGVNGRYTFDDVLLQAIEDAVNDDMDIITVSLGAPAVWGPRDSAGDCSRDSGVPCDWRADAIEQATRLGLVVVMSAGNNGSVATTYPSYNSIQTPGTAPAGITVGASTNRHLWRQSLRVPGSGVPADVARIRGLFGDTVKPNPSLTAPLRDVAKLDNDGKACTALTNGSLNGAIALIERGDCTLVLKLIHAQRAGAVGAVIYQQSGIQGVFPMQGVQEAGIPAMLIGNTDATRLKTYLERAPGALATMDPAVEEVSTTEFDTLAAFSSRGPALFRPSRPTAENGIKPEVVAVGTDLYVATQKYDPNGELFDASGYTSVQGTSFAVPIAAGTAAIVLQRNPTFTPAQVKSAVVNTAGQEIFDIDDRGQTIRAGVLEAGAGKLNAEAAARTNVTVEPSTLWFGVMTGVNASRSLKFNNHTNAAMALRLSFQPYGNTNPRLTITPANLNISPRGSADVRIDFSGPPPQPGVYEGWLVAEGGSVPLRIPYLYLVGDGVPFSVLPLEGDGFESAVNTLIPLTFKVTDRYGVPVAGQAVKFQVTQGGGRIDAEGKETDELGIGYARVVLGPNYGDQEFYAAVGDSSRNFGFYFSGRATLQPSIASNGIVNAGSGRAERGFAPGSYISIYGRGLAEVTREFKTPYLPLSIAEVSVSFDVPSRNLSAPGRLHFVSDGQINVQIPWELQGASSAIVKVSIGDSSSSTVTIPLLDYSPAAFEYREEASGRLLAAARDEAFQVVGTNNPARKGQVIQIYANGLGPVENRPESGEPASLQTLSPTRLTPSVTLGGRQAEVIFSGLAPGVVGLYQINVRIPSDAPSGLQPVVITANGIEAKASTVPVE